MERIHIPTTHIILPQPMVGVHLDLVYRVLEEVATVESCLAGIPWAFRSMVLMRGVGLPDTTRT